MKRQGAIAMTNDLRGSLALMPVVIAAAFHTCKPVGAQQPPQPTPQAIVIPLYVEPLPMPTVTNGGLPKAEYKGSADGSVIKTTTLCASSGTIYVNEETYLTTLDETDQQVLQARPQAAVSLIIKGDGTFLVLERSTATEDTDPNAVVLLAYQKDTDQKNTVLYSKGTLQSGRFFPTLDASKPLGFADSPPDVADANQTFQELKAEVTGSRAACEQKPQVSVNAFLTELSLERALQQQPRPFVTIPSPLWRQLNP